MPPNWPTAPANAGPAAPSALARALLRSVPGGYTITDLPIHVPVHPGETATGWLRRAAHRYGITPQQLLDVAGPTTRHSSTNTVHKQLLVADPILAGTLGLHADELTELRRACNLDAVLGSYLRLYRNARYHAPSWSRYCPACLAGEPPVWRGDWHSPLSLVCAEHAVLLVDVCPSCGQRPYTTTAWLGQRDAPAWTCPLRRPARRGRFGRALRIVRPFCGQDLREAPMTPASNEQHLACLFLADLATHPDRTRTACGITARGDVIAHAFLELLDAAADPWQPDTPAAHAAAHLGTALHVLRQPDRHSGGQAAAAVLSPTGRHAPIVIDSSLADRAHNPLLVALQLNHHAPRLTPAAQLSLRVGGPAPRYPSAIPSRAWRQLCLADHGPHRPTPDLAWIPQVLWPASIPQLPADSPTHAAVAALALSRTGSTRPFGLIALELGLPTSHASNVGAVWRSLHRSGQWETFLTAVDALMTRLQDHPPPVNYRTRRVLGDDTDLLERALTATAQQIGTPLPTADLPGVLARFWELFTGGDITFAPDQLRIPVKRTRHRRHVAQRGLLDRHHLPLYEATLATLKDQSLLTIDGPLTWIPP